FDPRCSEVPPMFRRDFLTTSAAALGAALASRGTCLSAEPEVKASASVSDRTYESPAAAMASPREELAYVVGVYTGTKVQAPDFLATVDLDPASKTYSQIIHRAAMPHIGDELHHFGWNACGSWPRGAHAGVALFARRG